MKIRPKGEAVPAEMHETVRSELFSALCHEWKSARELSSEVGITEKDVYAHLEHIRRSGSSSGRRLLVTPAQCKKCGFLFSKRERLKKPGKCPVCRGESIREPLFLIEEKTHP